MIEHTSGPSSWGLAGAERWDGHPRWEMVPEHLRDGLRRYVEDQIEPGGFLMAVLTNDLIRTVGLGTPTSLAGLHDLISFLWNHAPAPSWGTPQKVAEWLADRHATEEAREALRIRGATTELERERLARHGITY